MLTTKTFRVFLSSTFSDMAHERRYLQQYIFPKLREFCKQHGAKFQAVDLRWGVNEETQQDQKTMQLCLKEIKRCQQISPRPNFIVLIGNRYGWQPIPDILPESEMKSIISELAIEDKELVELWYKEDTNAIPPEFVLQPKGEAYKEYNEWEKVESKLRNILRQAVDKLNFTQEQRIKYFTSATHQEIMRGALDPKDAEKHVFCYFRNIKDLPDNMEANAYSDIVDGKVDAYSVEMIAQLKEKLQQKLDQSHLYNYPAGWLPDKKDIKVEDLEAFGNRIFDDLQKIIGEDLKEINSLSEIEKEIQSHREVKTDLLEGFAGREETIDSMLHYLNGNEPGTYFCLAGPSGSGKSSVMAKAMAEAERLSGATIIYRFAGTSPASSEILTLFMGINEQIARIFAIDLVQFTEETIKSQNINDDKRLQQKVFAGLINKVEELQKPLILFIDALDQLKNIDYIQIQEWIPDQLPGNIKIIISILEKYREKITNRLIHKLLLLPSNIAEKILQGWLSQINRTLTKTQFDSIIRGFSETGLPLFVKICFELAKEWRSFDSKSISAKSMDALLAGYFQTLETDHDAEIVKTALGYLLSGKDGLTEDEILDLFVFDNKKQLEIYKYEGPALWEYYLDKRVFIIHRAEIEQMGKFPVIVWSRMLLDLLPFLSERDIPGGRAFVFFHRIMAEFARERYYTKFIDRWHNNLADYFEESPLFLDPSTRLFPSIRRIVEQPYQETLSGQWDDLYDKTLGNYEFVEAKIKANMLNELLGDYEFAERSDIENHLDANFKIWATFIQSKMNILRRGNPDWPSYKIFLQLAIEHADESPVSKQADKYLNEGKVDWPWLRREQRVKEYNINIIAKFSGHEKRVLGAKVLSNGRIVSWSADNTVKLWEENGILINTMHPKCSFDNIYQVDCNRVIEVLENKFVFWSDSKSIYSYDKDGNLLTSDENLSSNIKETLVLNDGCFVSQSDDSSLLLWDHSLNRVKYFEGHAKTINGIIMLHDKNILSCSEDGSLRIWNSEGDTLTLLKGHKDNVIGAVELFNNQILSWSTDKSLIFWNRNGDIIGTIKNNGTTKGIIELLDHKILSWSDDNKLYLRDQKGNILKVLLEKEKPIKGALCFSTGNILSWGSDNHAYLWDKDGQLITILERHPKGVKGAIELSDGKIATWGADFHDSNICIWDSLGNLDNILMGHAFFHSSVCELSNSTLLSVSWDSTLIIWNKEVKALPLPGHNAAINRYLILPGGRILTESDDSVYMLWSKEGDLLKTIEPQEEVKAELVLSENKFATYSQTGTLYIRDEDGNQTGMIKSGGPFDCIAELSNGHVLFINKTWKSNGNNKRHKSRGPKNWEEEEMQDGSWTYKTNVFNLNGISVEINEEENAWAEELIKLRPENINFSWTQERRLVFWQKPDKPRYFVTDVPGWINGSWAFADTRKYGRSTDDNFWLEDLDGNLRKKLIKLKNHLEINIGFECLNAQSWPVAKKFFRYEKFPRIYDEATLPAQWHGEYILESHFFNDGRALVTQANGQVCFLKTFYGNKQVTLDELQELIVAGKA